MEYRKEVRKKIRKDAPHNTDQHVLISDVMLANRPESEPSKCDDVSQVDYHSASEAVVLVGYFVRTINTLVTVWDEVEQKVRGERQPKNQVGIFNVLTDEDTGRSVGGEKHGEYCSTKLASFGTRPAYGHYIKASLTKTTNNR